MYRRTATAATVALSALLTTAGCSGGSSSSSDSPSSLSAPDRAACDALNHDSSPDPNPPALESDFGLNATRTGMSPKLAPYAQLVGSAAQLENSGYSGNSKLGEYVGQMRGVCETLGWRAAEA